MDIKKIINKKQIKTILLGIFLSGIFCLPFVSSYFSNDYKIEEITQYISSVVTTSTLNKNYLAITVGRGENSDPVPDPYFEFYKLYGTFRQEQAAFGSGINFYNKEKSDKDHSIFLNDYGGNVASANLSLFYLGPVGSVNYNGHYKHYVYPFELMFEDKKNYDVSRYIAYISQTHADNLLKSLGETKNEQGEYTNEQYQSLVRKKVTIDIDSVKSEYVINNIYYEYNYYYGAMKETFSDYILTSYYSPNNNALMAERKNIYFMNQYAYQNQYYIDYINKTYSSKQYDLKINKTNITNEIDDEKILDFYYSNLDNMNSQFCVAIIVLFYILLVLFLGILILSKHTFSILSSLFFGLCTFIPYIGFYIFYKINYSPQFFTKISGYNFFLGLLTVFFVFIVWHFIYKYILAKYRKI